jgi:hypothetical protein
VQLLGDGGRVAHLRALPFAERRAAFAAAVMMSAV